MTERLNPAKTTAWGRAALIGEAEAVRSATEGNRNQQLNQSAFRLGQAVAGGQLDEEAARQALEQAAGAAGLAHPKVPEVRSGAQPEFFADPVDLWGRFQPPELPQGLLPPLIENFARETGALMGADPAGLAVAALVTCAAAIPDKMQLRVKRHDTWTESARVWGCLVGPPSSKKSPILAAATAPLCDLDGDLFRKWRQESAVYWATDKDQREGPPPQQTRHRIEDTTIEACQDVLAGSPWGVLVLQDELSGFFGAMDRYNAKGAAGDRAFWLRASSGGEYALNRVGRGVDLIPNLLVCLLGGIQPELIRQFAAKSADDGLLQRMFPIILKSATVGQDQPQSGVHQQYETSA